MPSSWITLAIALIGLLFTVLQIIRIIMADRQSTQIALLRQELGTLTTDFKNLVGNEGITRAADRRLTKIETWGSDHRRRIEELEEKNR